jgi:hypothetical protein
MTIFVNRGRGDKSANHKERRQQHLLRRNHDVSFLTGALLLASLTLRFVWFEVWLTDLVECRLEMIQSATHNLDVPNWRSKSLGCVESTARF